MPLAWALVYTWSAGSYQYLSFRRGYMFHAILLHTLPPGQGNNFNKKFMNVGLILAWVIGLALYLFVCVSIANYFVKTRKISFDWAVFLLFFGGLIIGGIALEATSKKEETGTKSIYTSKESIISISVLLFAASLFFLVRTFLFDTITLGQLGSLQLAILFFGSAVFWINKLRTINGKNDYNVITVAGLFSITIFAALAVYGWGHILIK